MANQGRDSESERPSEIFLFEPGVHRLPRSQLISHQVLSGPSASKQPFTHAISLKTTLSSGIVHACTHAKSLHVSL